MSVRRDWLEKDFYAVLGVDRTATGKDLKKSYRKLAQQFHPDTNPGDDAAEARFKEVTEAYDVLSDPKLREEYDQARDAFARGAWAGSPQGGAQYVRFDDLGDIGDLGSFFGGSGLGDLFRGGRRGPQKGADLEGELRLTFHEAIAGSTRTLTISSAEGPREVQVKIPPGVDDGQLIRVKGKGGPGIGGGPPGDILVRVRAGDHPLFTRKGLNLELTVPITYAEAALGANITVPTLEGKVTLKVPPATQSGRTFRVSGKGVAGPKRTGDLLVSVEVAVPETLTDAERALIEQLKDLQSDDPRPHLGV
ncbi:MAG: DnaJ C-terminal domain-containing protein [Acidimicrobiia bacterium]